MATRTGRKETRQWWDINRLTVFSPKPGRKRGISAGRRSIRMDPKILTADEVRARPWLSIVFIEYFNGETQEADPLILAAMMCRDGTLVDEDACIYNDFEKDIAPDPFDGSRWRFWDAEPTEEQRKAVPWDA
jgi:hypothetical protein